MPVTARLSKRFCDRFGDEVVGELVDWLNSADADYRTALREQNEANFVRFDAKPEQRVGGLEPRLGALEGHLDRIVERLDQYNVRLSAVERALERGGAELREFVERSLKEQTRWMFVAWASLLIPIIGLWFRG